MKIPGIQTQSCCFEGKLPCYHIFFISSMLNTHFNIGLSQPSTEQHDTANCQEHRKSDCLDQQPISWIPSDVVLAVGTCEHASCQLLPAHIRDECFWKSHEMHDICKIEGEDSRLVMTDSPNYTCLAEFAGNYSSSTTILPCHPAPWWFRLLLTEMISPPPRCSRLWKCAHILMCISG